MRYTTKDTIIHDAELIKKETAYNAINSAIYQTNDKGVIYGLEKAKDIIRDCISDIQWWQIKEWFDRAGDTE